MEEGREDGNKAKPFKDFQFLMLYLSYREAQLLILLNSYKAHFMCWVDVSHVGVSAAPASGFVSDGTACVCPAGRVDVVGVGHWQVGGYHAG